MTKNLPPVEDIRIKDLSDFDKGVLREVVQEHDSIANQKGGVDKYIRQARQKLDPLSKTYLHDVRKVEILGAYDRVASTTASKIIPRAENKVGYDNFYKALHGESPTGQPLESQRFAAEKGLHDHMPEKSRNRFFEEKPHGLEVRGTSGKAALAEAKTASASGAFKAASAQRGHAKVFVLASVAAVALGALAGVKLWGSSDDKKPTPPEAPKADKVSLDRLLSAGQAAVGAPAANTPVVMPQPIVPLKPRLGGPH